MNESPRSVLRLHVVSLSWLAMSLGISWAALGPTEVVLAGLTTSAAVTAAIALTIGLVTASLAARLLWVSIPVGHVRVAPVVRRASVLASTSPASRS